MKEDFKACYFSTEELSVGYNGKALISDINVGIQKGEILTLIGPNGSGKSTILKSITKHLSSIAGVVYIGEKAMHLMSNKETATKVSVVLTERITPELMTCGEVVAMGRYPYTNQFGKLTDKDVEIVMQSLEKVHAVELYEKPFSEISDGQRQRIMLARAICQEPEVIVLDEPTSYLDIRHKIDLLNILREMARIQKITVVMSLHEIDLAYKISDKIMCVKGDSIQHFGTPEDIFTDEIIKELYEIENGSYDRLFGSVELTTATGDAQILVIGGNGSGIPFYRMLQRHNIPFMAAVLFENDMDYRIAKQLATEVVSSKPFVPIDENARGKAFSLLENVSVVIDCGCEHGEYDYINVELLKESQRRGKIVLDTLEGVSEYI